MPARDRSAQGAYPAATYRERLHVPLRWWVQATMFLATVWLAFTVAVPGWLAWAATAALLAAVYGMFAWVGSVRVEVRDGVLYAGPARIALEHLGPAVALDKEQTHRVHGVDADARAFLVTRPYGLALSQTEAALAELPDQLTAQRVVVVVVGAGRWSDREFASAGRLLRTAHEQEAVLFAPLLAAKALPGLGPDPLPKQLTNPSQHLLERITTITGPLTANRT